MRILTITIFLGILIGCDQGTTGSETEELNVLNQTFLYLVRTEWYYEPPPPPPMPLFEESTKEDTLRYKSEILEYKAKMNNRQEDSSELQIYLSDTLRTYKGNERLENILSLENFDVNFPVDTSWIVLIRKLNQIQSPKKFDLRKIEKTGKYVLVSKSEFNDTTEYKRKIGKMTFSRVAFSDNQKRGVFYYAFQCGRLCGWGSIVFVEKKGKNWEIVGERGMWVS